MSVVVWWRGIRTSIWRIESTGVAAAARVRWRTLDTKRLRRRLAVGVASSWGWMCEWLDAVGVECKVVEIGQLFERLDQVWMLVGNVLFDKVCGFEQLQASLASEFALVLLLDVTFHRF